MCGHYANSIFSFVCFLKTTMMVQLTIAWEILGQQHILVNFGFKLQDNLRYTVVWLLWPP